MESLHRANRTDNIERSIFSLQMRRKIEQFQVILVTLKIVIWVAHNSDKLMLRELPPPRLANGQWIEGATSTQNTDCKQWKAFWNDRVNRAKRKTTMRHYQINRNVKHHFSQVGSILLVKKNPNESCVANLSAYAMQQSVQTNWMTFN